MIIGLEDDIKEEKSMLPRDTNVASDKVVLTPTRIDLHIHSAASTLTKDAGDKELAQCDSSEGALSILMEQLELHGINMCAITDHDTFDLNLYQALKAKEGKGTLKKVLPGVEFTVSYVTGKDESDAETKTTIHIVAIFDDRQPDKLTGLNDLLVGADGNPRYNDLEERAFSEDAFVELRAHPNASPFSHYSSVRVRLSRATGPPEGKDTGWRGSREGRGSAGST